MPFAASRAFPRVAETFISPGFTKTGSTLPLRLTCNSAFIPGGNSDDLPISLSWNFRIASPTPTADLPGVTKEDLTIRIEGGALTIEAPLALGESQNLNAVYSETRSAHYKRSFTLSRELDTTKIDAALKDGVLKLHVPKLEHAKPRRIEVRTE